MADFDIIPKMKQPGEGLAKTSGEILKRMMEKRMADAKLAEEVRNNDLMNQYRMGELGLAQEQQPLKLDLLRKKIEEAGKSPMSDLTKASATQHQKVIAGINNLIPGIEELTTLNFPGQIIGWAQDPDSQKDYKSRVNTLAESYVGAMNLPKTNQSLALAKEIMTEGKLETRSGYQKRMKKLIQDLHNRKQRSIKALRNFNQGQDIEEPDSYTGSTTESSDTGNMITIKNKKTGEIKTIPREEAMQLGVTGV